MSFFVSWNVFLPLLPSHGLKMPCLAVILHNEQFAQSATYTIEIGSQ
jgi:hypothetical protein